MADYSHQSEYSSVKILVLRSLNEQIMKRFVIAICRYAVSSIDEKVETEGSSLHVTCFVLP